MDFIADNAVQLSAILLGVLVLAGLVVLALAGLRLWRRLRTAQGHVTRAGEALSAESERLQQALDRLPERQAELQREVSLLQQRVAALGVLARHTSEALEVLRSPLRFLGR